MRSIECSIWNAPDICPALSTPFCHIVLSSMWTCAGSMNNCNSPGSVKSVCAASRVRLASRSSPARAIAAAAMASSVPPRQ